MVLLHIMDLSILIGLAYFTIVSIRVLRIKLIPYRNTNWRLRDSKKKKTRQRQIHYNDCIFFFWLNLLPTQNTLYKQNTIIDFGISGSKLVKQGLSC